MAREIKSEPRFSPPRLDPPGLAALRKRNMHLLRVPVNGRNHPAYYLCYPGTPKNSRRDMGRSREDHPDYHLRYPGTSR